MMTPYRIIVELNRRFDCNYPTQMGYNYVRNNLIPATKVEGKWSIEDEAAEAWISKFAAKNNLPLRK